MKKFKLVMFIGNCENFGTEWEELDKKVKIVEAESKEEVEDRYSSDIYDCDCKSYYIEEVKEENQPKLTNYEKEAIITLIENEISLLEEEMPEEVENYELLIDKIKEL